jgi:hypothetical protein
VVRLAGLQSQEYLHLRPQPNSMLAELLSHFWVETDRMAAYRWSAPHESFHRPTAILM